MFSEIVKQMLVGYRYAINKAECPSLSVLIGLVLVVLLLLWRIWTFTVLPALYPQEPKMIPYWIPGVWISYPALD
jgi:hypothetical protein